jgi:hypothetical protein
LNVEPYKQIEWLALAEPSGFLNVARIAQIILQDEKVSTVEARLRKEEEAKQAARREAELEAHREAELARAREKDRRAAEAAVADEAKRTRDREAQRVANIRAQGWPTDIESAVIQRRVIVGMNSEQVISAWGQPGHVNETVYAWGTREQWVYSGR